jgi:Putative beta barrel porin-7 (BBP7)
MIQRVFVMLLVGSLTVSSTRAQEPLPSEPTVVSKVQAPPMRLYGQLEYVLWWLREGRVPPLLTTSSPTSAGRLGEPDTRVLYGDDRLETRHGDRFNGARFTVGWWLNDGQDLAIEADGFFLERDSTYFKAVSAGEMLLARPYFDAQTGASLSKIIAGPDPAPGRVFSDLARSGGFVGYSRVELFGQQLNLILPLWQDATCRVDLLGGARFLQMRDRLDLTAAGHEGSNQVDEFGLTDHFRVDDRFYGGQLGLRGEAKLGSWFVNLRGTAALGGTEQVVRAFGETIFQTPLLRTVQPYGLAVLPSNTGHFTRTDLDAVFEVGANVGYQFGPHFRVFAGYTFLYWNNPIRAGDQVDLSVNASQLRGGQGGPARPSIPFHEDPFWAQGLNAGLEFRW